MAFDAGLRSLPAARPGKTEQSRETELKRETIDWVRANRAETVVRKGGGRGAFAEVTRSFIISRVARIYKALLSSVLVIITTGELIIWFALLIGAPEDLRDESDNNSIHFLVRARNAGRMRRRSYRIRSVSKS